MSRKIISYNVNGIRAALKKDLIEWVKEVDADVICIQETKSQEDQFDKKAFEELGYTAYIFSAERKGYSGVAILTKETPKHIEYGMGIEKYDVEGRMIRVDFDDLSVASIYHPNGTSGDIRQAFKMQWLEDWHNYVNELRKTIPNLVLCGDYNIAHEEIDIHDPKGNAKSSGFLPEERAWVTQFLESGYIDSFRKFNPDTEKYSWWSYRTYARSRNKGWRIDYCMTTDNLLDRIESASILNEAEHSDHCPVEIVIK